MVVESAEVRPLIGADEEPRCNEKCPNQPYCSYRDNMFAEICIPGLRQQRELLRAERDIIKKDLADLCKASVVVETLYGLRVRLSKKYGWDYHTNLKRGGR